MNGFAKYFILHVILVVVGGSVVPEDTSKDYIQDFGVLPGPIGEKGGKGVLTYITGPPGEKGEQITCMGCRSINTMPEIAYAINIPIFYENSSMKRGTPGIKGERGYFGIKGDRGENGFQGIKGEFGQAGFPGLKGAKGAKGDQGIQGPKGNVGEVGEEGPIGPKGSIGYPGIKGDQGTTGECSTQDIEDGIKILEKELRKIKMYFDERNR